MATDSSKSTTATTTAATTATSTTAPTTSISSGSGSGGSSSSSQDSTSSSAAAATTTATATATATSASSSSPSSSSSSSSSSSRTPSPSHAAATTVRTEDPIVFRDVFTGDEVVSDEFDFLEVEGVVWEVKGKIVTKGNFDFSRADSTTNNIAAVAAAAAAVTGSINNNNSSSSSSRSSFSGPSSSSSSSSRRDSVSSTSSSSSSSASASSALSSSSTSPSSLSDENLDALVTPTNQIVKLYRLHEVRMDRREFLICMKEYLARLRNYLEEHNPRRLDAFMHGSQVFVKKVMAEFNEYQFFTGPSADTDAMVILQRFKEDGITPYLYYWRDGLKGYQPNRDRHHHHHHHNQQQQQHHHR